MCLAVTDRWILIIFGNTVSQKVGTWKIVRFLPCLISISALPCKIAWKHGNYICSVYFRGRVMLCQQTHKTRQTYHLVRDRLYSLIHSWSNQLCAPNKTIKTGHKASSHLICIPSVFTVSAMRSSAMSMGVFFANTENQWTLPMRYLPQYLQMLTLYCTNIFFSVRKWNNLQC